MAICGRVPDGAYILIPVRATSFEHIYKTQDFGQMDDFEQSDRNEILDKMTILNKMRFWTRWRFWTKWPKWDFGQSDDFEQIEEGMDDEYVASYNLTEPILF